MDLILQILFGLTSGVWICDIAVAKILNATPFHNPVGSVEALACEAGAVAVLVELEGLKKISVLLSNWLKNLCVVKLDVEVSSEQNVSDSLGVVGLSFVQVKEGVVSCSSQLSKLILSKLLSFGSIELWLVILSW